MSALDKLLKFAEKPDQVNLLLSQEQARELAKLIKDQSDALELYESPDSLDRALNEDQERVAFVREAAISFAFGATGYADMSRGGLMRISWEAARELWAAKPEDC